jgi:thiol-disulfide isomerase/thioredoxin
VVVLALGAAGMCGGLRRGSKQRNLRFRVPSGRTDIFSGPPENRGTVGAMSCPDLMTDGKTTALSGFAGKVVVINLWGQWCAPCRRKAPELEKVFQATRDSGVQFLAIHVTRNRTRRRISCATTKCPTRPFTTRRCAP